MRLIGLTLRRLFYLVVCMLGAPPCGHTTEGTQISRRGWTLGVWTGSEGHGDAPDRTTDRGRGRGTGSPHECIREHPGPDDWRIGSARRKAVVDSQRSEPSTSLAKDPRNMRKKYSPRQQEPFVAGRSSERATARHATCHMSHHIHQRAPQRWWPHF